MGIQSIDGEETDLDPLANRRCSSGLMIGRDRRSVDASTGSASVVAMRISDFLVRTEAERRHLFRLHLHTSVRLVSPLLIDLAALEGISLTDALPLIHPPDNWPWRPLYDRRPSLMRHSLRRKNWMRAVSSRDAWHFERTFAKPGVVLRQVDHPNGRFAIRPCGAVLGFTAAIGPCQLSAFGRTAVLKLPDPIPETILAAIVGRMLDEVVDHPVFAGRGYVVRDAKCDLDDGLPVIVFSAKLVPFSMLLCCSAEQSK